MTHAPETGTINRLHFEVPILGVSFFFCTIYVWNENF